MQKIYELRLFIEHLKTFNFLFSVICIQESWLSEGADTSLIQLEGYKCCSSKGGFIIYLHENFNYKRGTITYKIYNMGRTIY